jgi:hypothetical protein
MFDFLNKLTHEHHALEPPSPEQPFSPPEDSLSNSGSAEAKESRFRRGSSGLELIVLPKRPVISPEKSEKKSKRAASLTAKMQVGVKAEL